MISYLRSSKHCVFGSDGHFDHSKNKQNRCTRHVSWAQNYQNCFCGEAQSRALLGELTAPQAPRWISGEGRGEKRRTGKTGRKGRGKRGVTQTGCLPQWKSALEPPVLSGSAVQRAIDSVLTSNQSIEQQLMSDGYWRMWLRNASPIGLKAMMMWRFLRQRLTKNANSSRGVSSAPSGAYSWAAARIVYTPINTNRNHYVCTWAEPGEGAENTKQICALCRFRSNSNAHLASKMY